MQEMAFPSPHTPEIYKNLENVLFKTVSGDHFLSESLST